MIFVNVVFIWNAKIETFFRNVYVFAENSVSLQPICGAARLNRESGENPEQFPLLYAHRDGYYVTEIMVSGRQPSLRSKSEDLPCVVKQSFRDKSGLFCNINYVSTFPISGFYVVLIV